MASMDDPTPTRAAGQPAPTGAASAPPTATATSASAGSATAGSASAGPGPLPRVRPPGAPGIGSIFVLAFLVILVPGVAVYVLLDWAGLPIGGASLLGLLVVFLGLGFFPTVLRRLGWVPTKKRRS